MMMMLMKMLLLLLLMHTLFLQKSIYSINNVFLEKKEREREANIRFIYSIKLHPFVSLTISMIL